MGYASGTSGVTLGTSDTSLFSYTNNANHPAPSLWVKARTTNSINGNVKIDTPSGGYYVVMEAGDQAVFANVSSVVGYASATTGATFDVCVLKE